MREITNVCLSIVSQSNGMGYSYIYENAKDVLRWNNLSVKKHIRLVMNIGTLVNLSQDSFEELVNENQFLEVSKDDLAKMYE